MKTSLKILAIIVWLGGLTVAAQAQVIGNWQGSSDGWIDWGNQLAITDPGNMPGKYQFVGGAVSGYGQSLQLSQSGWNQGLAIKLENIPGGKAAFLNNHLLSITWSVPAGTGSGYEQLGLNINAQGYGFNLQPGSVMSITGSGSINGNNAELDFYAGSPVQTQTVTWDYSSILPAIAAGGAGWIELIFTSSSGGGAPGIFYFNNAEFGPQPFTYQGRLNASGGPANGLYDFRFTICDALTGGNVVAGPKTNSAVGVTNGLFTVAVDSGGGVFTGNARWLELGVRPNGSGDFITLAPRQPLTPTPYAIFANTANNVSGTISVAQLSGTVALTNLPGAVVTNNADGVTLGGTFNGTLVGDGSGLTGLNTSQLTSPGNTNGGYANFFVGPAGNASTSGAENTALGDGALANNTTGSANTASGNGALANNTTGSYNTADGNEALLANTNGVANTANGFTALYSNTSGNNNTANGFETLQNNTTGSGNTAVGFAALFDNVTGGGNTANGDSALDSNTNGNYNTANGGGALEKNTSGSENTADGFAALNSNAGDGNTALGFEALSSNTNGSGNIAVGENAGANLTTGDNNIYIGNNTGASSESGVIRIGTPGTHTATYLAGTVNATAFSGDGSQLTGISGSSIAAGSIGNAAIANNAIAANQINSGQVVKSLNGLNDAVTLSAGANITLTPSGNNIQIAAGANAWNLTGNAGTTPGVNFVGTTDNQPLEFHVNNLRAVRYESGGASTYLGNGVPTGAPNVIGGSPVNFVVPGVVGAVIAGGGATNYYGATTNSVAADFGTIGGGQGNTIQTNASGSTIGGGYVNTIQTNAGGSMIGGGYINTIQDFASNSVVAGGIHNQIQTEAGTSVIGGGGDNTIQTNAGGSMIGGGDGNQIQTNAGGSMIGGGYDNSVSGSYGTVPGGDQNVAANNAFAAGHRAKANHTGSFVWADSTDADFEDTANNQFLIRASGNVGINTANPQRTLDVQSGSDANIRAKSSGAGAQMVLDRGVASASSDSQVGFLTGGAGDFSMGTSQGAAGVSDFSIYDYGTANNVLTILKSNGNVGIGTTTPSAPLQVNGEVKATVFTPTSDRNAKENFAAVNPAEVLQKVAALPITEWNYKTIVGARHVGPMAQDFRAAFGLGSDDKGISTVDADGVALAAIQGLNQKLDEKDDKIKELESRLEKLEQMMNAKVGETK